MVPKTAVTLTMKFSFGEAQGKEAFYGPVIDALAEKSMTVGELCARPALAGKNPADIIQALAILTASGQVSLAGAKESNKKSVAKMNQAILDRAVQAADISYMVSPLLRTGISVPWFKQLLFRASRLRQKPEDYVWEILQAMGQRLQADGKPILDPEKNKEEIRLKMAEFVNVDLPHLRGLGVE
jgi:hypothetical protein